MSAPLLAVRDLSISFGAGAGMPRVRVVDGVGFEIAAGETLALVGESGCGKSVTALALPGLLPRPAARVESGEILFDGEDLLRVGDDRLRALRGRDVAMIFQEPMNSLNPVQRVGDQIMESLELHLGLDEDAARVRAIELLARVGIPAPERRVDEWPHRLSGGMRQRVMIAMALACGPRLLIADEPTTALDVTVQAQVLGLLAELRRELGLALLLITHDLGVVAQIADRVAVMYAGRIVEEAPVHTLFARPRHPYSAGLLRSVPRLDRPQGALHAIPGTVPDPRALPPGCAFHPRCEHAQAVCRVATPHLVVRGVASRAACLVSEQAPALDLLAAPGTP